jgi:hypothetical protein
MQNENPPAFSAGGFFLDDIKPMTYGDSYRSRFPKKDPP